ncbi:tetratricopeptide repeat protein [Flavobacterium sp. W21_SRS_FM6]|uniref:tetratricopeptide repeat protein n=1 Tax=Flavobacterium sp. W21_SRS_FM6 TaxID=3240268 RepID=UPI003F924AEE
MSVVNKMLRDLEARQSQDETTPANYVPRVKPAKAQMWLTALGVLILIVLLYIGFNLIKNSTHLLNNTNVSNEVSHVEMLTTTRSLSADEVLQNQKADVEPPVLLSPDKVRLLAAVTEEAAGSQKVIQVLSDEKPVVLPISAAPAQTQAEITPLVSKESPSISEGKGAFTIKDSTQASQSVNFKQRTQDAITAGDSELAIRLLKTLVQQEPDNIDGVKKLASLLFAQGNSVEASQLLQQSLQNDPSRNDLRLMLARLSASQDKPSAALVILKSTPDERLLDESFLAYRAALAQQLGDAEQAQSDYLRLTEIDKQNARWWLGLAITHDKFGAQQEALKAYQAALGLAQLESTVNDFIRQRLKVLEGAQ